MQRLGSLNLAIGSLNLAKRKKGSVKDCAGTMATCSEGRMLAVMRDVSLKFVIPFMFVCSLPLLAAGYRSIAPRPVATAEAGEASDQECARQWREHDKAFYSVKYIHDPLTDACRAMAKAKAGPLKCSQLFVDNFIVWFQTRGQDEMPYLKHGNAEGDINSVRGVGCSGGDHSFLITLALGIYRWTDDIVVDERGKPEFVDEGPKSIAVQQ